MKSTIILIGVLFVLFGIVLGAFGAHALENKLSTTELNSLQTGIQYQLYHGLALLVIGLNFDKVIKARFIGLGIIVGTLFFSGSIYLLSLDTILGINLSILWPVTPIGGFILIGSWGIMAYHIIKKSCRNLP